MFALAGILGLNVEKMISGDTLDFRLRAAIAERASELRDQLDDSLALKIVNRFSEAINAGKS
jgi:hypothetical protein